MGAFFSAIKMLAGKQRKRKYKKREPEKEREKNRKRKRTRRHFGVFNAISNSFIKYGAIFDYRFNFLNDSSLLCAEAGHACQNTRAGDFAARMSHLPISFLIY